MFEVMSGKLSFIFNLSIISRQLNKFCLTFSSLFISKAYKRENATSDFKDLTFAKHMSYFHNKYVVVPADNATSNIVFVCTSHYIDCLMFSLSVLFIILLGDTLTSNTSLFGHVISIESQAGEFSVMHALK
jgi:hypothetical protein